MLPSCCPGPRNRRENVDKDWEIVVASDAERDDLFAEVYHGGSNIAEVTNDPRRGTLMVELFASGTGAGTVYDLNELLAALQSAKRGLEEMGYPEQRRSPRGPA